MPTEELTAAETVATENSLPSEYEETQEKIALAIDNPTPPPLWLSGDGKIHDVAFCVDFISQYKVQCINGKFFDVDGVVEETVIENLVYEMIKPFLTAGLSNKVKQLVSSLKLEAYAPPPEVSVDRIHLSNGTLFIETGTIGEKEPCLSRLNVNYNKNAIEPKTFLKYLSDLLEAEDIPTLQEWLGYLLIPSTKGQKMLMLIGNGGEGKSRLSILLKSIFGKGLSAGNLQSLETNKFARATLENVYCFIDDDMKMEALPQTNMLKTFITAEAEIEIERKNIQAYQSKIYARIMGFGNGTLSALYDKSDAFYRRQIIVTTKQKPADRVDDPFLTEKMIAEEEGIFLWALAGLHRLLKNDFRFTISERAKENLLKSMENNCNIILFLKSSDWVTFNPDSFVSTKDLYNHYAWWCDENCEKPISQRAFSGFINQNPEKYNLKVDTNGTSTSGTEREDTGVSAHTNNTQFYTDETQQKRRC